MGIGRLHSGGRLLFGPQGYLWIAVGEGYSGTAPQDLSSLGGKVLRIDSQTGAAAPGNPFESSLVYVYGFRNPQGLALRPSTNQVWLVDHGPTYDDEINLLVAGDNYGWDPVPDEGAQGSYDETTTPMTDVVKFPDAVEAKWTSRDLSIAPSGGTFLEGDDWEDWEGRLAVATLKTQSLRIFEFTSSGDYVSHVVVPELLATYGRLRSPVLGPDGALYITTSNEEREKDRIFRVSASRAPAFLTDHETRYVSEALNAQGTVAKVVGHGCGGGPAAGCRLLCRVPRWQEEVRLTAQGRRFAPQSFSAQRSELLPQVLHTRRFGPIQSPVPEPRRDRPRSSRSLSSSSCSAFGIHPVSRLLPPRYRARRNSRSPSSDGISPGGFVERYQRGQLYAGHGSGRGSGSRFRCRHGCGGGFWCRSGCGSRFWRSSRCGSGGWSGRRSRLVAGHECDDRRTKERCEDESRVDWNPQRKRS